jgi:hypothetical protein
MDRLHQVIWRALALLFLAGIRTAVGADYWSLLVHVVSPDGRRPQALVSVIEKNGRTIERDPTADDVKFCDLGIDPVTVKVGTDGTCNQVVVKDIPLVWQEEYHLTVTYDLEPCLQDLPRPPVPVCHVLVRVSDASGKWLEKASIRFRDAQPAELETDNAGRAVFLLSAGERREGVVALAGYGQRPFSVSCTRKEPQHEEIVKLVKTSR